MNISAFSQALAKIKELQLSSTLTTWHNIRVLVANMPSLRLLEVGYNQLRSLALSADDTAQITPHLNMEVINLDSNDLSDWKETCIALQAFPKCVDSF